MGGVGVGEVGAPVGRGGDERGGLCEKSSPAVVSLPIPSHAAVVLPRLPPACVCVCVPLVSGNVACGGGGGGERAVEGKLGRSGCGGPGGTLTSHSLPPPQTQPPSPSSKPRNRSPDRCNVLFVFSFFFRLLQAIIYFCFFLLARLEIALVNVEIGFATCVPRELLQRQGESGV